MRTGVHSSERAAIPATLFLLLFVAFGFVALRLDAPFRPLWIAAFGAAVLASGVFFALTRAEEIGWSLRSTCASAAIVAAFAGLILVVYTSGHVLPAHDPIAIPVLSQTVAAGHLPLEVYPHGSSAFSYPPGLPIVLAVALGVIGKIESLWVVKVATLGVVALIPLAWAWSHRRLFATLLEGWQVVLFCYLAFFGIERTLGFAVPFAGKVAVLVGVFLCPIVVVLLVRLAAIRFGWILGALALFGLILVHYTMLHLTAALVGSYVLVKLASRDMGWAGAGKLLGMGVLATALTFVLMPEIVSDPRSGSLGFDAVGGLRTAWQALAAKKTFIVIFMDADFGIRGSPYRGLLLVAATMVSVGVAAAFGDKGLLQAAATYFLALLASLGMAVGIVPTGLTADFGRWFMWAIQAMVLASGLLALAIAARRVAPRWRYPLVAAILALVIVAGSMTVADAVVYRRTNKAQAISKQTLEALAAALGPADGPCVLIGDSALGRDPLSSFQISRTLDYAEAATSCRYLNGSWVNTPAAGARELDGLPSPSVIQAVPPGQPMFFVGRPARFSAYADALRGHGLDVQWQHVADGSGFGVWRRRSPALH